MKDYDVRVIDNAMTTRWLLEKHYAKRQAPISYSFGLYRNNILEGIVTYGTPVSSTLTSGVCGKDYKDVVIELNRLCINSSNHKNCASFLISSSLKLLPNNKIIVSYADTNMEHIGYVYQASNWKYTGLSEKRTDWKLKSKPHLHGHTIADEFRGMPNRAKLMREKYGDDFYLKERSRKHRYVYFIGDKRFKKKALQDLKYPLHEYPKGDTKRYDCIDIKWNDGGLF